MKSDSEGTYSWETESLQFGLPPGPTKLITQKAGTRADAQHKAQTPGAGNKFLGSLRFNLVRFILEGLRVDLFME